MPSGERTPIKLLVSNLSGRQWRTDNLELVFNHCGAVLDAKVHPCGTKGELWMYGPTAARAALALNDKILPYAEHPIKVALAPK